MGELVDGLAQERFWATPLLRYDERRFYAYYADAEAFLGDLIRAVIGEADADAALFAMKLLRRSPTWPPSRIQRLLARIPAKEREKLTRYGRANGRVRHE